jgi:hypothetical protein
LRDYPGARLAAAVAPTRASVFFRNGDVVLVSADDAHHGSLDPALLPCAVYAFEISGRLDRAAEQGGAIKVGNRCMELRLARHGGAG